MTSKLLVANRGEIAIRICRTAAELDIDSVAIYPEDDGSSLHVRKADEAVLIPGRGVAAYLDGEAILAAAKTIEADTIHPGYGFLSENAAFARACASSNVVFVGPSPETLELFGDKHAARRLAVANDVPVLPGTEAPTELEDAKVFFRELGDEGAVMVKAVGGGGGRGIRPVLELDDLDTAFERCRSEAISSFGNGDLYVERMLRAARHIEVQIIGDGHDVVHLFERDCSVQRRRQKIVEFGPAINIELALRERLREAACRLGRAVNYVGLGTIEFLVDASTGEFYFIEANPRLQVEHTVTEEITGLDLVAIQLRIAAGQTLSELGLEQDQIPQPRGVAVQVRINTEIMQDDGQAKPAGGTLRSFAPPTGKGIRVDTYGYSGYRTHPGFDSLLAKLIVHQREVAFEPVLKKAYRALCEFQIEGVATNIGFLQSILLDSQLREGGLTTNYLEVNARCLLARAEHPRFYFESTKQIPSNNRAGAQIDSSDPLSVLAYGQATDRPTAAAVGVDEDDIDDGLLAVRAPLQGTVVSLAMAEGDQIAQGSQLAVMEAMKMEHEILAETSGVVRTIHVAAGDTLWEEQLLMVVEPIANDGDKQRVRETLDYDYIRPDLDEVLSRRRLILDELRPRAVERRHSKGHRTVRENVGDLVDNGTFVEYGPLVVAAQRHRRALDDLMTRSPADGLVTGVGQINGDQFASPASRAAIMAYDYTVFAGTQGVHNHWKTDRLLDIAEQGKMPLIVFAEGGGGRPGDTDYGGFVGQNTFHHFGRLSGLVPMIGIVNGRCFAGNAALLGCCDVIIATEGSNIGMGGPAMVEGGGLGVFAPEEIGPMSVQTKNGVVDLAVKDEAEAVAIAKRYLSYFQGNLERWQARDQRKMRHIVPENRLRVYEVRDVINTLADEDSVLELRHAFGKTMVTALIRIEGRPVGVVANDPKYLGGAIDSDGSDKGARFMQLCDAFDIPVLFLCDTPGIMVGPEIEKTALVRHSSRLFLVGCNMSVPYFTVVLRKAYGLGAIGMAGGNFRAPYFTVSWPTGEFGPMGLEGQVKLGYRAELEAIEDPDERRRYFDDMVAQSYEDGKALHRSTSFGIDDTIDPAETRNWLASLLSSIRPPVPRDNKKRPMIDAW